jgi:hypothetical protein
MTHEELRDRLLDLACGELSPRDAREVEEHAASCEGCRAELASMRGTRRVMAALPVEPAPERGERILVAAARDAVRARTPRRAWPRWLWVAPVAAASLATVVAMSLRLGAVRPPDAARELEAPLAPHPEAAQQVPAAPGSEAEQGALAERAEPPPAPARKAEPRFAAAPDGAPAPSGDRARAAPSANAAPPSATFAVPPQAAAPAPAAPPQASTARSAPGGAPAADAGPAAGGVAAQQDLAEAESRREAPPARRAAKAMAAPESRDATGAAVVAPRERAVAAARTRADQLGVDTGGAAVQVGAGPVTWDAWRAQDPARRTAAAAPEELKGRRFWPVTFSRPGARGGALTVFVEDGTFRPLVELQGE